MFKLLEAALGVFAIVYILARWFIPIVIVTAGTRLFAGLGLPWVVAVLVALALAFGFARLLPALMQYPYGWLEDAHTRAAARRAAVSER